MSMPTRGRALIGISCYVEPASWGAWREVPAALLPHRYVAHVQAAGGTAVVVPPLGHGVSADDVRDLLARLDGLVLAGGADVEPARYGERPHPSVQAPRRDRDESELALVAAAIELGLPLLGVCRGMQVMAVAAGGALEQHLPERLGNDAHAPAPGSYGVQQVRAAPGSRIEQILGPQAQVHCYHHQGVLTHPGYVPSAWAQDGTLEAFEVPGDGFRLAVQWHPEQGRDGRLFQALVAAARGVPHWADHADLGDH